MSNVIPIASTGAENAATGHALPSPPFARYTPSLGRSAARWWRIVRLVPEAIGWMVLAGLVALLFGR